MASTFIAGCAICDNGFDASDTACATRCGHTYHRNCLLRWFQTQREQNLRENCPTCRAKTNSSKVISLYLHQVREQTSETASELDDLDYEMRSIDSRETTRSQNQEDNDEDTRFSSSSDETTTVEGSDWDGRSTDSPDIIDLFAQVDNDEDTRFSPSPDHTTEEGSNSDTQEATSSRRDDPIVIEDSDIEEEIERDRERRVEMGRQLQ